MGLPAVREKQFQRVKRVLPVEVREALARLRDGRMVRKRLRHLERHLRSVREFTMVPDKSLRALAAQVLTVLDEGIEGSIVECGAWRGGVGFLLAKILDELGMQRRIILCDSFSGLPAPAAIDGASAASWAKNPTGEYYFDNCRADAEDVFSSARRLGVSDRITFIPGWFDQTLPVHRQSFGPIAILRIDADWHASVLTCLEHLYAQVSPGGFIILDDYDTWDGCTIAVHEFLASRKLPHRIMHDGCAYFRKT